MSSISETEDDAEPDDMSEFETSEKSYGNAELDAARRDEFESLKAIYADDDIKFKEWQGRLGFKICFGKMKLEIVTDNKYPAEPPLHISVTGISVPGSISITASLTDMADTKRGSFQLFDLIEEARTMLDAIEEKPESKVEVSTDSLCNVEFPGYNDAAPFMNGITLEMIANRLRQTNVTILHTELVMNPRLVNLFKRMQEALSIKYSHLKRVDYTSVDVSFHGTQRKFIPGIISRGFVKPGDVMNGNGDILQVRCGSTWGRGIYTSPEPRYSMSYSDRADPSFKRIPGQKIIVCAILRGRAYTCSDYLRNLTSPLEDYDSHVSPGGFEYIVFNSSQLLPLYVLHVTDGDPNLESFWKLRIQQGPPVHLRVGFDVLGYRRRTGIEEIDDSETNLTLSMRRKILTKVARKHFPLGFGPATGDKFIVEEIGAVDDDEEEWGEYQMDRKGFQRDGLGISYEEDMDEDEERRHNLRDEFQKARYKYQ